MKLMEVLVGSVLMYGAEVWGGGGQLGLIEGVQMQAARIFLGGGGGGGGREVAPTCVPTI